MLGFENGLDIYATHGELNVRRISGVKYKKYLAKIVGAHPTYGLSREFLRYKKRTSDHDHIYYNYGYLPDGVYETSVRYYPHGNTTDDPLEVVRKICVVSHGDYLSRWYSDMEKPSVLDLVQKVCSGDYTISDLFPGGTEDLQQ